MNNVLLDTILDCVKLLPFLYITYLIMEYIEHKTSEKTKTVIKRSGKFGPIIGGIVGVTPQCGFSAAAASLYAGRIITMGTLIAIFLSTSDEMLPILISQKVDIIIIIKILGIKMMIGMLAGLLIDHIYSNSGKKEESLTIHEICEHDHCNCENGIFRSSFKHTLQIIIYIFLITFILNSFIFYIGEENVANIILNKPFAGSIISGIVGLIPNCAASVIITQLYLDGIMSTGAMLSGLLVGAGVGILILFKVNKHRKENIKIVLLLYAIGVMAGTLFDLFKFVL